MPSRPISPVVYWLLCLSDKEVKVVRFYPGGPSGGSSSVVECLAVNQETRVRFPVPPQLKLLSRGISGETQGLQILEDGFDSYCLCHWGLV